MAGAREKTGSGPGKQAKGADSRKPPAPEAAPMPCRRRALAAGPSGMLLPASGREGVQESWRSNAAKRSSISSASGRKGQQRGSGWAVRRRRGLLFAARRGLAQTDSEPVPDAPLAASRRRAFAPEWPSSETICETARSRPPGQCRARPHPKRSCGQMAYAACLALILLGAGQRPAG